MAEKKEKRAKLFRNGGSQAVRLPKEFQFEGTEVRIFREGEFVVLEPVARVESTSDEAVTKLHASG
jgi:antitoxin VapB